MGRRGGQLWIAKHTRAGLVWYLGRDVEGAVGNVEVPYHEDEEGHGGGGKGGGGGGGGGM